MFLRSAVLSLVLVCLTLSTSRAQESDPAALAQFDAALVKVESDAVSLRKWQYQQVLTTRQFDDRDRVTAEGTWKSLFRPGEKDPIQYLSEDLDGTLTFFHKSPDKEKDKAKSSNAMKVDSQSEDVQDPAQSSNRVDSLAEAIRKYGLRDRYLWTGLPDEKAAGEDAAVISFRPKPGVPIRTREQRFFSQLSGKIWISREDNSVLKSEGALLEPYRLFWIIARITKLNFQYEVESRPANRLLRKSEAAAETIVSFPFKSIHQKHQLDVERYEPRSPRK